MVSHNHLSRAGSTVGTWFRRWGEQLATSGRSSLYSLMSTYRKENLKGKLCCVYCTRTMTQCMSLHASELAFLNRGGRILPHWRGMGNFVVETWGEVILTIWTFLKGQKQHSVNIERWLKSKLPWPVCTKSMKLKYKWCRCNDYNQK